jgi:hypothetical protein
LWWMIFLICCWTRFAIILLRIFASMFISSFLWSKTNTYHMTQQYN